MASSASRSLGIRACQEAMERAGSSRWLYQCSPRAPSDRIVGALRPDSTDRGRRARSRRSRRRFASRSPPLSSAVPSSGARAHQLREDGGVQDDRSIVQVRRPADWFPRRQREIDPAERLDPGANRRREVARRVLLASQRFPQDAARLFFHRPAPASGSSPEALFGLIIKISDGYACQEATRIIAWQLTIRRVKEQRGGRRRRA